MENSINCLTDCPRIGHCCKVFYVSGPSNKDELVQRIAEDTPFTVLEEMENLPQLVVTCRNLCTDGLCQDYENRPELCRSFQPGSDSLCILFCGPPTPYSLGIRYPVHAARRW